MTRLFVITLLLLLLGCQPSEPEKISIAINPWPGYEFLYLAKHQGYFKQVGLNIELIQVATLSDAQRAYLSGRVEGFTSTLIEAVQVEPLGGKPVKVVLAADYSNGGDVIVTSTEYRQLDQLKGKTIGCEVGSLGLFVLARALASQGMTLDDVIVQHVEQGDGLESLKSQKIAAMVTYSPYTLEYLKEGLNHLVFSSDEIPFEILDTLSLSADLVANDPSIINKIHQAWQMALDFYAENKVEAASLMAQREGISREEFLEALSGVHVLSAQEQEILFIDGGNKIKLIGQHVCHTLGQVDALETDCSHLNAMFMLTE